MNARPVRSDWIYLRRFPTPCCARNWQSSFSRVPPRRGARILDISIRRMAAVAFTELLFDYFMFHYGLHVVSRFICFFFPILFLSICVFSCFYSTMMMMITMFKVSTEIDKEP